MKFSVITQYLPDYDTRWHIDKKDRMLKKGHYFDEYCTYLLTDILILIENKEGLRPSLQMEDVKKIMYEIGLCKEDDDVNRISSRYFFEGGFASDRDIRIDNADIPRYITEKLKQTIDEFVRKNDYEIRGQKRDDIDNAGAVIVYQNGCFAFYDRNGEITSTGRWYDDKSTQIDYSNSSDKN